MIVDLMVGEISRQNERASDQAGCDCIIGDYHHSSPGEPRSPASQTRVEQANTFGPLAKDNPSDTDAEFPEVSVDGPENPESTRARRPRNQE